MIHIYLFARHFKDTQYCEGRCAIDKAMDEQLGPGYEEAVHSVWKDGGPIFNHAHYGQQDFLDDEELAMAANYDDTIIRTIQLIPV